MEEDPYADTTGIYEAIVHKIKVCCVCVCVYMYVCACACVMHVFVCASVYV